MRRTAALMLALGTALAACERHTPVPAAAPPPAAPSEAPPPAPKTSEPPVPEVAPLRQAGALFYEEVRLGGAKEDATLPMIVAIHGLGDEPRNFGHLFETFSAPARLILPRAIEPVDIGGYSWFPLRARDPDVEALSEGIASAADALAKSVSVLVDERPTVGKPIITGFSQGGMLTMTLAVHHPEIVGHAVAIGGWLPPPLWPASDSMPERKDAPPPIVALHGTADAAVRYAPTKRSIEYLDEHGFDVELKTYEGAPHVITPAMQRDLYDALRDAIEDTLAPGDSPP